MHLCIYIYIYTSDDIRSIYVYIEMDTYACIYRQIQKPMYVDTDIDMDIDIDIDTDIDIDIDIDEWMD